MWRTPDTSLNLSKTSLCPHFSSERCGPFGKATPGQPLPQLAEYSQRIITAAFLSSFSQYSCPQQVQIQSAYDKSGSPFKCFGRISTAALRYAFAYPLHQAVGLIISIIRAWKPTHSV